MTARRLHLPLTRRARRWGLGTAGLVALVLGWAVLTRPADRPWALVAAAVAAGGAAALLLRATYLDPHGTLTTRSIAGRNSLDLTTVRAVRLSGDGVGGVRLVATDGETCLRVRVMAGGSSLAADDLDALAAYLRAAPEAHGGRPVVRALRAQAAHLRGSAETAGSPLAGLGGERGAVIGAGGAAGADAALLD